MAGGRPTKQTDETRDAIIAALQKGYPRSAAAAAGGIAYSTMREWEKAFPEFSEALEKAEGAAKSDLVDKVAAAKSWQAAAWLLERRWPTEFAQRKALEMSGPDGGPIDHRDVSGLADHEKEALADAIRDHLASGVRPAVPTVGAADSESGD